MSADGHSVRTQPLKMMRKKAVAFAAGNYSIALPVRAESPGAGDCWRRICCAGPGAGREKLLARVLIVAAQHVGVALVVEDLGGRAENADRLGYRRGRQDQSGAAGHRRRPARARPRRRAMTFGARSGNIARPVAVVLRAILFLTEVQVVVWRRLRRGAGQPSGLLSASADRRSLRSAWRSL